MSGKFGFESEAPESSGGGDPQAEVEMSAEELQERTDKLCTAVWTKDVGTITLLADQRTINHLGVIKRNTAYKKIGEGLEHGVRLEPPIRLAAERPPSAPLHYAAAAGDLGMIELLLRYGADQQLESPALGLLPWEIAQVNGFYGRVVNRLRPRWCWCFCMKRARHKPLTDENQTDASAGAAAGAGGATPGKKGGKKKKRDPLDDLLEKEEI